MKKPLFVYIILLFFITNILGSTPIYAQEIRLPAPGVMVHLSPEFAPPLLKGIKIYRNNPFRFDFILDTGDATESDQQLKIDSNRLIKYFLASLTVPEKDLWVNLSPYEKDHIVPEEFGQTEMGRDLLAQDYILKQITASVIYPESKIGKEFWDKVYAEASKRYGKTDIPVNTFNKVWIIPEKATVYEHKDSAFVIESKLKVMLEEDYLALEKNIAKDQTTSATNKLGSDIVREVVIPILEKEVNEGKNFAQLRQVYNSLILATWYKRKVKESMLGKVYADQKKTAGIDIADKNEKDKIWKLYVEAFKKGSYNYIREEYDSTTKTTIPRKYFSGGTALTFGAEFQVKSVDPAELQGFSSRRDKVLQTRVNPAMKADTAMAGRIRTDTTLIGDPTEWLSDKDMLKLIRRVFSSKEISDVLTGASSFGDEKYDVKGLFSIWRPYFVQILRDVYFNKAGVQKAIDSSLPKNVIAKLKAPINFNGHKLSRDLYQIGFRTDLLMRYVEQKVEHLIQTHGARRLKIVLGGTSFEEVQLVNLVLEKALRLSAKAHRLKEQEFIASWDIQIVAYSITTDSLLHIKELLPAGIDRPKSVRLEYMDLLDEFQLNRLVAEGPDVVICSRTLYISEYYAGMGNPIVYPSDTRDMAKMRAGVRKRLGLIKQFVFRVYQALPDGGAFLIEQPFIFQPDFSGFQYVATPLDSLAHGSGMMLKKS